MYSSNIISNFAPSQHRIDRAGYGYSRALETAELIKMAPAIFADAAHESRSQRYAYIPTLDIVNGMRAEGFFPVKVTQANSRDAGRTGHSKHMIRFRRQDQMAQGEAREVVLVNSHDGTSGFNLMAGMFRLICSNGLIVGKSDSEIRVRHSGSALDKVIEGAYSIVKDFDKVTESVEGMKALTLNPEQQRAFGRAALALRFDGESPVAVDRVLRPVRSEDTPSDLFTTFNVVQEHLIKGGLRGVKVDENGRRKNMSTRTINGIDQNVTINRGLWVLAEEMRKLMA